MFRWKSGKNKAGADSFPGSSELTGGGISAAEGGRPLPENLTFVGFDNILGDLHFPKPITSIDGNLREEARAAIELLRNRIHEPGLPPQCRVIPVKLVRRDV